MSLGSRNLQNNLIKKLSHLPNSGQPIRPPILLAPYLQNLWAGEIIGDIGDWQPVLDIHPGKEKHLLIPLKPQDWKPIWCTAGAGKAHSGASGSPPSLLGSMTSEDKASWSSTVQSSFTHTVIHSWGRNVLDTRTHTQPRELCIRYTGCYFVA